MSLPELPFFQSDGPDAIPENFLVDDVFFQSGTDEVSAMNKARETLALIKKNNNDLSKLAGDKSIMVRRGGVTEKEYPNIFQAAAKMKSGDLSDVIKESDGLHIIKMLKKEPFRQFSFEEARVDIEHRLMGPVMNKRKTEWENRLKKTAKIEIMQDAPAMPAKENKGRNQ